MSQLGPICGVSASGAGQDSLTVGYPTDEGDTSRGHAPPVFRWKLVPVVIRFVGSLDRHIDVFGLFFSELGKPHAQLVEVKASHLLV